MIYDSSVLLNSNWMFEDIVTVPEVISEIKDRRSGYNLLCRSIRVLEPSHASVKAVMEEAAKTGDILKLSSTDIKLVALALERREPLVSDDYDIQNICRTLKIQVKGFSQKGIKNIWEWKQVCGACGKKLTGNICDVCGSEAKTVHHSRRTGI